jgi:hypothetical protein
MLMKPRMTARTATTGRPCTDPARRLTLPAPCGGGGSKLVVVLGSALCYATFKFGPGTHNKRGVGRVGGGGCAAFRLTHSRVANSNLSPPNPLRHGHCSPWLGAVCARGLDEPVLAEPLVEPRRPGASLGRGWTHSRSGARPQDHGRNQHRDDQRCRSVPLCNPMRRNAAQRRRRNHPRAAGYVTVHHHSTIALRIPHVAAVDMTRMCVRSGLI